MAVAQSNEGFRSLLKKRNFVRLWLAQLISMTVFNATNYALIILIGKITGGDVVLIGLVIICFSLPAVLIGAPAGVFVDRMDKRRVLWLSNCLRALIMLIFVLILFADRSSVLIPIYLLTFALSAVGQFFSPAEGSAIPMLVSEQELTSALSLFNVTFMLSQALGYILLAPIAILLPTFTLFGIQIDAFIQLNGMIALLYLVCAFLIITIPPAALAQARLQQKGMPGIATQTLSIFRTVWEETVQGWNFINKRKLLYLAVVQLSLAGVLILIIGQLALPIVNKMLGLPDGMMPFVFAPAGIGLVIGSFLMPRVLERLGRSQTVFIGTTVMAIAMLLAPLATLVAHILMPASWNQNPLLLIVVGILMFIAGMSLDCINIPAQTSMQERSPDWIKGRVLSLQLVLYNAVSIPIILFTGVLTNLFRVDRVLYMIAVCVFLFGLWSLSYERKHINDTPPADYQQEEEQILIAEIAASEVTSSKNV